MKQFLIVLFGWLLIATSCDPCTDCEKPLSYDPVVKLIFINQDSADVLTILSEIANDSIDTTSALIVFYNQSIQTLEDSLIRVDSLVQAGESDYLPIQTSLNELIADLEESISTSSSMKLVLDSINDLYQTTLALINSGSIQLQEVKLLENNSEAIFEDSMALFRLPLLLENGLKQTTFTLTIDDNQYELSFSYNTDERIDDYRFSRINAINLDTIFHTFDSLTINCTTSECISDETTVTAYF